jgi:hypothetical protein
MHSLIQMELARPVKTPKKAFGSAPRLPRQSILAALRARRRRGRGGRSLRPAPAP